MSYKQKSKDVKDFTDTGIYNSALNLDLDSCIKKNHAQIWFINSSQKLSNP